MGNREFCKTCQHQGGVYGDCHDCGGTGYESDRIFRFLTSEQERELFNEALNKATKAFYQCLNEKNDD